MGGIAEVPGEELDQEGRSGFAKQRSYVPHGSARPSLENPAAEGRRTGALGSLGGAVIAANLPQAAASGRARRTSFMLADGGQEEAGGGHGSPGAGGKAEKGRVSPVMRKGKQTAEAVFAIGVGGPASSASGNDEDARSSQAGSEAELAAATAAAQQAANSAMDSRYGMACQLSHFGIYCLVPCICTLVPGLISCPLPSAHDSDFKRGKRNKKLKAMLVSKKAQSILLRFQLHR